jgi:hypothetical protein
MWIRKKKLKKLDQKMKEMNDRIASLENKKCSKKLQGVHYEPFMSNVEEEASLRTD